MKPLLEKVKPEDKSASFNLLEVKLSHKHAYWHYHPEIEITYILNGQGTRFVGDHVGQFKQGDLVITGVNLPHDFNVVNGDEADFLVIQFSSGLLENFAELDLIHSLLNNAKKGLLFSNLSKELSTQLTTLEQLSTAKQLLSIIDILLQLAQSEEYEFLCNEQFALSKIDEKQQTRLNQVLSFITQHYARAIGLHEVADLTCMTEQSFCRWFKKTMDCNFTQYLHKVRIEEACRILIHTDAQVSVIAGNCGFDSISSFNRAFSRIKNMSPNQYRKQWQY